MQPLHDRMGAHLPLRVRVDELLPLILLHLDDVLAARLRREHSVGHPTDTAVDDPLFERRFAYIAIPRPTEILVRFRFLLRSRDGIGVHVRRDGDIKLGQERVGQYPGISTRDAHHIGLGPIPKRHHSPRVAHPAARHEGNEGSARQQDGAGLTAYEAEGEAGEERRTEALRDEAGAGGDGEAGEGDEARQPVEAGADVIRHDVLLRPLIVVESQETRVVPVLDTYFMAAWRHRRRG